jgi:hypothetical protein
VAGVTKAAVKQEVAAGRIDPRLAAEKLAKVLAPGEEQGRQQGSREGGSRRGRGAEGGSDSDDEEQLPPSVSRAKVMEGLAKELAEIAAEKEKQRNALRLGVRRQQGGGSGGGGSGGGRGSGSSSSGRRR